MASVSTLACSSGTAGLSFETNITVVNQACGFDLDLRHPVATLQLAGQALIELDQIAATVQPPGGIFSGMASVVFYCEQAAAVAAPVTKTKASTGPFKGHDSCAQTGSVIGSGRRCPA